MFKIYTISSLGLNLHIRILVIRYCYHLSLLLSRSWVVFVYAIAISLESILIEFLATRFLQIPPITLSAISITLAGTMLLLIAIFIKKSWRILSLFSKSSKNLILSYFTLAVGIFTWYDSISRIGASKEVLIAGPLEIVIIVVLARIFLKEKLVQTQVIGIILALMGFLMAVASDVNVLNGRRIQTEITTPSMIVTFGDIEAILSAFGFGIGVLFSTKLVFAPFIHESGRSLHVSLWINFDWFDV